MSSVPPAIRAKRMKREIMIDLAVAALIALIAAAFGLFGQGVP